MKTAKFARRGSSIINLATGQIDRYWVGRGKKRRLSINAAKRESRRLQMLHDKGKLGRGSVVLTK